MIPIHFFTGVVSLPYIVVALFFLDTAIWEEWDIPVFKMRHSPFIVPVVVRNCVL